jgi:hypothetical protein
MELHQSLRVFGFPHDVTSTPEEFIGVYVTYSLSTLEGVWRE